MGKISTDTNHTNVFLGQSSKAIEMKIKTKINKWDLIKLKSFCTAKETINKVKRPHSEWEKTTNETTEKGLVFKMYKQSYNSIPQKQTTQRKSGKKDLNRISPKKTYRWLTNT